MPLESDDTKSDFSVPYSQASAPYNYEEEYQIQATDGAGVESQDLTATDEKARLRQMTGAAVVGGLAGLLLVGPVVGLVAAGGAAALATTKGKAGDVARATGEATASVGQRLKKMDEKHHITEKTTKGIVKGATWVSDKVKPKK